MCGALHVEKKILYSSTHDECDHECRSKLFIIEKIFICH